MDKMIRDEERRKEHETKDISGTLNFLPVYDVAVMGRHDCDGGRGAGSSI